MERGGEDSKWNNVRREFQIGNESNERKGKALDKWEGRSLYAGFDGAGLIASSGLTADHEAKILEHAIGLGAFSGFCGKVM